MPAEAAIPVADSIESFCALATSCTPPGAAIIRPVCCLKQMNTRYHYSKYWRGDNNEDSKHAEYTSPSIINGACWEGSLVVAVHNYNCTAGTSGSPTKGPHPEQLSLDNSYVVIHTLRLKVALKQDPVALL
jgi:hypothetical protein